MAVASVISELFLRPLVLCDHCIDILLYMYIKNINDHEYTQPIKCFKKFPNFATRGGYLIHVSNTVYEIVKQLGLIKILALG